VAAARREEEIEDVLEGAFDRYGPFPDSVLNLADYGRIRVMADRLGIDTIDREGRTVVLKFRPQAKVDPVRLVSLVRQRPDLTLLPPAGIRLSLDGDRGLGAGDRKQTSTRPTSNPQSPVHSSRSRSSRSQAPPSWWVARARETEITAGFTKEEMTRPGKEDPRAPGGVFERVGALLSDLVDQS
jgi:hypothetical protein